MRAIRTGIRWSTRLFRGGFLEILPEYEQWRTDFSESARFREPDSVVGSNTYTLTVGVTDGTAPVTQSLTISVTDLNDPPVFNSSATISVPKTRPSPST